MIGGTGIVMDMVIGMTINSHGFFFITVMKINNNTSSFLNAMKISNHLLHYILIIPFKYILNIFLFLLLTSFSYHRYRELQKIKH